MDPQVAAMLAALGDAGRSSSSYISPSSVNQVSWGVPMGPQATTAYMPPPAQAAPPPTFNSVVPPPAPEPAMAASAPDMASPRTFPPAMDNTVNSVSPPTPTVDPGTMPGSLGGGALAQPGGPTLGPVSQPDQPTQFPDMYQALFNQSGAPAAGYAPSGF